MTFRPSDSITSNMGLNNTIAGSRLPRNPRRLEWLVRVLFQGPWATLAWARIPWLRSPSWRPRKACSN